MNIRRLDPVVLDNGEEIEVWRVPTDINGNSRYVVHFLDIPYQEDPAKTAWENIQAHETHAANCLHGSKYRAKWFGGGIVFQAPEGHKARVKNAIALAVQN